MSTTEKLNNSRKKMAIFPWIVCGLGALFYTYEYILRISPSVMSTELMQAYGISAGAFGNLIAFYYYAYSPMQLPVGLLVDRYGPRRLLTLACIVCAIGSYLFASSGHIGVAGFGRFLVGFGSAFAFVGVLKLATIWLPPERFAMVAGLTGALGSIGALVGDNVLSGVVAQMGWRSTVMITAVLGIVIAVVILLVVRDSRSSKAKALDRRTSKVDMAEVLRGMFVVLKNPYIWINGMIGCLLYLPATAFAEAWGIPYFRAAQHFSTHEANYAVSAVFLGFTIGGPLMGWFSDKLHNRRVPMLIGGVIAAACMFIILYVPALPVAAVYGLMLLLGLAFGSQVIVFAVARDISTKESAGTSLAVTNMLIMLGGVVFQPMIGMLLDMGWTGEIINNIHIYTPENYRLAITSIPICILLGTGLILILKETYHNDHEEYNPS
ncbi:MAG: MFS transporter [Legionellales bacterium]|nr:MFS transporter [Legionellales bacterium]